jgi:MFS family permease
LIGSDSAAGVETVPQDQKSKGNLLPMLAIAFIVYIFGFFFNSARLAFIPLIVPRDQYMQANSANMTLLRIATGLGTVAGGITVFFIGWRLGFFFDAVTYVISFFLLLMIKVDEKTVLSHASDALREAGRKFSLYLSDIKVGFQMMTRTLTMRFVMISIFVLFFISGVAFSVILPTIQQTLGMGTPGVTVMAVAVAIGMVAGPVLTGVRGTTFKKHRIIIVSFVIIGILFAFGGASYLLVGLDNVLATSWLNWLLTGIMAVVLFAAGALFAAINISQDTLIQERIPAESRGRLFAWREMLASLAFVATAVPAGFIAERVSFEYVLVVVGVVIAIFAVAWIPLIWNDNKFNEIGGQK